MSENYPIQNNFGAIEQGVLEAASSHWQVYYAAPEDLRLGDESVWDNVITTSMREDFGIPADTAAHLNQVAKLDSQF